jgi:hypothetical protein
MRSPGSAGEVALQADARDRFNFAHPALGDDQVRMGVSQERPEPFQASGGTTAVRVDWIGRDMHCFPRCAKQRDWAIKGG